MEELIPVAFGWRVPAGETRVKAVFSCALVARDAARDRWLVQLRELTSLASTESIPAGMAGQIRALSGCYAYVPSEVKVGMTLPMKIETLDGRMRYFYAENPQAAPQALEGNA